MIRGCTVISKLTSGVPRASGDDPSLTAYQLGDKMCSPRERG